jgi:hypothetical protein
VGALHVFSVVAAGDVGIAGVDGGAGISGDVTIEISGVKLETDALFSQAWIKNELTTKLRSI